MSTNTFELPEDFAFFLGFWQSALAVRPTRLTTATLAHVLRRYCEPQRYYHTLDHLRELLELYQQHSHQFKYPRDVILTLFYHDAIYEPERQDNELQSAHLAGVQLSNWLNNAHISRIKRWILATADHRCPETEDSLDLAYLLDLDLAILASEPAVYEQYTQAITKEYSMYTGNRFYKGRQNILNQFLMQGKIFHTSLLGEMAEFQARANIQTELKQLKKMCAPALDEY